jgi:hypothetical protein
LILIRLKRSSKARKVAMKASTNGSQPYTSHTNSHINAPT